MRVVRLVADVTGVAIGATALLALACATGAQPDAMVATPIVESARAMETVTIHTCGGAFTVPPRSAKISNGDLREAVARSLAESGLLRPVEDHVADYHLEVCIVALDQPNWAFTMTVELVTDWRLQRRDFADPLWQERLAESHSETVLRELFGVRRARLATEGAARETIAVAVRRIAEHLSR